jgi:Na+-transporting methylmalonyl-CoA/oxaloacetate decarboxylase gamma subunit
MLDALIVTGLGMGVVFIGLALTSLMIWSFSAVPGLFQNRRRQAETRAPAAAAAAAETPVDPRVLAVILTVLEIELRLYMPQHGGRLTMTRTRPTAVQPPPIGNL